MQALNNPLKSGRILAVLAVLSGQFRDVITQLFGALDGRYRSRAPDVNLSRRR